MKLGLSSLIFVRASMREAIRVTAELGYECIEVIHDLPHFGLGHDRRELLRLKKLMDGYGLEVSVHTSFWDLNPSTHYPELFKLTVKQVKRGVDACKILGGDIAVIHPGRCATLEVEKVWRASERKYLEFLDACAPYAKRAGVKLAIENGGTPNNPYSGLGELSLLVSEFEEVGIAFDIGHAYLRKRKLGVKKPEKRMAKAVRNMREKLLHVHLHDNDGEEDKHLVPGKGKIDFGPILEAIRSVGYQRMLIAELWNPKKPIETAREGLKRVKWLLG